MPRFNFIGDSYAVQSPSAAAQKTMNWYLQVVESDGKSRAFFMPSPGIKSFCNIGDPKVRGLLTYLGPGTNGIQRCFAVGQNLYEIDQFGNVTNRGAVAADSNLGSMVAGPNQLLIASGGNLYVLNLITNALQGPLADPVGVLKVGYSDGFGIALIANSNKFRISAIPNPGSDLSTWPAGQVVAVSYLPDNIVGFEIDHRELWLWGNKSGVVYQDTGSLNVFDPLNAGGFIENGLGAPFSTTKIDNSVFWIDQDERGGAVARRAIGYQPQRISTHAVEATWQSYLKFSDAIGYSFQVDGHPFWHLYFPSVDNFTSASWRYDIASQLWHEVGTWTQNGFEAHLSQCHTYAFGKHLVGDYQSGNIYEMSSKYNDDNGTVIRRVRRAPAISGEQDWIYFYNLVIWLEAGLALQTGQGSAPVLFLRWSDDGGHTWSNEYQLPIGTVGQYKARALKHRLGRARTRIFEVSVSDPIPWRLIDAYYNGSDSQAPEQRLTDKLRKSA